MSDVVTLDQLNSDPNPALLTVDNTLPAQILYCSSDKEVGWDVCWEYIKKIIFPLDEYQTIDALQTGIDAISTILVSDRRTGEVKRSLEALMQFPDLSDLIAE